jgi:hypothetical protein
MGVDSGLPDFRGRDGFWRVYPALQHHGLPRRISVPSACIKRIRQPRLLQEVTLQPKATLWKVEARTCLGCVCVSASLPENQVSYSCSARNPPGAPSSGPSKERTVTALLSENVRIARRFKPWSPACLLCR